MRQEKLINLSYVARAEPTLAFTWLARPPTTWQTFQKLSNSWLLQFLKVKILDLDEMECYRVIVIVRTRFECEWVSEFFKLRVSKSLSPKNMSRSKSFSHLFWWLGLPQPKTNKLIIHIQLVKLQKTLILAKSKVVRIVHCKVKWIPSFILSKSTRSF